MGRKHEGYKKLVREAKERMTIGAYDEISRMKELKTAEKTFIIGDAPLTASQICDYYERVAVMQQDINLAVQGVGALIDQEIYDRMEPPQRERYVLLLAALYRELKDEYERKEIRNNFPQ